VCFVTLKPHRAERWISGVGAITFVPTEKSSQVFGNLVEEEGRKNRGDWEMEEERMRMNEGRVQK
jgi:hypothetical protein